jgi:hypothetical protein
MNVPSSSSMRVDGGTCNPLIGAWMFKKLADYADRACDLYRATRPTVAM